jgi:hypothetical protein
LSSAGPRLIRSGLNWCCSPTEAQGTGRSLIRKRTPRLHFTLSPKSRQQVFALGPRLSGFKDSLDKSKVAFTGTKTLRYEDGAGNSPSISYGFTSSPELRAVTELLDGISETIELGERLRFQLRFDKLALDSTLRGAEELVSLPRLPERQILEPILTRIADDATVMNIARQRARRILKSPAN